METFFLGLLGLQSGNLKLLEILIGVPLLVFELPEYISTPHLQRFLEYGLLFKGLFARCLWMITTLLRISKCYLQWPSRTHTWQCHRSSCNHPRLQWILCCFDLLPASRFSEDFFPQNFTFAANNRFIFLLNDIIIKLQNSTRRYVG